jgi:hypothetical protein
MSALDFKPKVSSSLPRGFRSVKLNFANGYSDADQVNQSSNDAVDYNNNQIGAASLAPHSKSSRGRSPTQHQRASTGNRHAIYSKQSTDESLNVPEVPRHSAPANSPPPPPVPPPPAVLHADAPIYLQPYEMPPDTNKAAANSKPFWSLPEVEQRAVLHQLSRSPSPVIPRPQSVEPEQIEHVITDRDPPSNAQFLYETDSHRFYSVPSGSRMQKVLQVSTSGQTVRPEGIGPVTENGVPVALRTVSVAR